MTHAKIINNQNTPEYFFEERCHIVEWLNAPADGMMSIARARVEPGVTTRLHRLKEMTERYILLEGTGSVEVGTQAPSQVNTGDIVIIPPGVPQRITNIGNTDLIFLAICTPPFHPDAYEDLEATDA